MILSKSVYASSLQRLKSKSSLDIFFLLEIFAKKFSSCRFGSCLLGLNIEFSLSLFFFFFFFLWCRFENVLRIARILWFILSVCIIQILFDCPSSTLEKILEHFSPSSSHHLMLARSLALFAGLFSKVYPVLKS